MVNVNDLIVNLIFIKIKSEYDKLCKLSIIRLENTFGVDMIIHMHTSR